MPLGLLKRYSGRAEGLTFHSSANIYAPSLKIKRAESDCVNVDTDCISLFFPPYLYDLS